MDIKYKKKQRDEDDITDKVEVTVEAQNGMALVYLSDTETKARIGFFTLDKFHYSTAFKNKYRLVYVWKSIEPSAKTWFKVFRKKVSNGE